MAMRRADDQSLNGGPLFSQIQTFLRTDNFHNVYTLTTEELGRGKFAVVRKCIEKATEKEYAAKFLKKRRRGQDCKAEIIHEIAVLEETKSNPWVVNLYEAYETTTEIILVLEYVAGGEIFTQCVAEGENAFTEDDVIRLIQQILEGVLMLHQNNIVHLDLKPQNILLTSSSPVGDIKIVDFGLTRRVGNTSELREIMGTPEYVAPEILSYEPITTVTDMWSIGVIAYMMLTGESPFLGEDKQETYLNVSQVNVDYSEETFSGISESAIDFIKTLLVKNPEDRATAESCLSHPWLQQEQSSNRFCPPRTVCIFLPEEKVVKALEEKNTAKSMLRQEKENIPDDSSIVPKRFRFDNSVLYPHETAGDLIY
ncbi:serine/threonine-protein kinase 17B [Latimeria chalumnae]|uniref:serine/threonine-protein kinase 17B n=1 Tax=Latimeria chalumnae TaxID=7897 RepID=UPI0006D8FBCB|nr:PREDICTED: serine/threonine-protein kinase 17B [Latimeria chalumnae]|eukprot:XP_014340247.1 PREDICTED: serine/threonine-protein kinase 17B [Latimeria chalumnae]